MTNVIELGFLERIVAVIIGGIAIYLGYRLFLQIPQTTDSSGKFKLPWNMSIVLTRVGPGIFFALFGTVVVGSSFYKSITYTERLPSGEEKRANMAAGLHPTASEGDREDARMLLRRDFAILNTLPPQLDPHLQPESRSSIQSAIPRIKFALMEPLWGDDWGNRSAFKQWIESGETQPSPGLEKAVEYYRYGEKKATP